LKTSQTFLFQEILLKLKTKIGSEVRRPIGNNHSVIAFPQKSAIFDDRRPVVAVEDLSVVEDLYAVDEGDDVLLPIRFCFLLTFLLSLRINDF
jgi:hypothetical protein